MRGLFGSLARRRGDNFIDPGAASRDALLKSACQGNRSTPPPGGSRTSPGGSRTSPGGSKNSPLQTNTSNPRVWERGHDPDLIRPMVHPKHDSLMDSYSQD